MPRKAPEVIVDSGFALMSRICMLRGSSVSFIQRRRLLVMELWKSNKNKLNIKVCICKIREQLRLFVSQRWNLLESATCKVDSAAAVESPKSRESRVDLADYQLREMWQLSRIKSAFIFGHTFCYRLWVFLGQQSQAEYTQCTMELKERLLL